MNHRPHESKDLVTNTRTQGGEPGIGLQYRSVCTHLPSAGKSPGSVSTAPGGVRVLYVKYNRLRNRPRALQEKRQCYRRHRSKERDECKTREPERAWITGGRRGLQVRWTQSYTAFFTWKIMTVDEHEYHKVMRERETRIKTFIAARTRDVLGGIKLDD